MLYLNFCCVILKRQQWVLLNGAIFMYALNSKVLLLSAPLVKRESCTLSYYVYIDIHSLYISPFLLLLFPADLTTQNDLFSSRSWACDASYVSACAPRENARRSINTAGGASKSSTVDVCHLIFECAHTRRHTPWRNPAATILFVDRYSLGCGRDRALVSGSATNEGGGGSLTRFRRTIYGEY